MLVQGWHPEISCLVSVPPVTSSQGCQSPVLFTGQLPVVLLQTPLPVVLLLREHSVLFIGEESSVVGGVIAACALTSGTLFIINKV